MVFTLEEQLNGKMMDEISTDMSGEGVYAYRVALNIVDDDGTEINTYVGGFFTHIDVIQSPMTVQGYAVKQAIDKFWRSPSLNTNLNVTISVLHTHVAPVFRSELIDVGVSKLGSGEDFSKMLAVMALNEDDEEVMIATI